MASQTQGIQQLLAAEKRADEKVNQARKRKAMKLKKAKEEAQAEVLRFREEREKQFKDYEKQHMGSKESNAAMIEETTVKKIEEMKHTVAANKNKVIDYLISQVFNVEAKVHQNFIAAIDK
ncbi:V-type proton ATPase subunit G-like [Argiope bruennichi]|uniref:V-type proton ATPase subunit G-like n=1 Tax=Argiope bruennichi TaxID=94029 RepID=UPI00249556B6|nr:V-type proton ATPase subunit G-like [Argiope bruennichi]XP_055926045.1 V-type proton ATPase subunit G-like [Argiope bruennichi]